MKVGGLHHLALKARDVERVAAFYRDLLGLEEIDRHLDDRGLLRSIWLGGSEMIVMIERSLVGGPTAREFSSDPPGLHLVAFAIAAADREAWRERLMRAGFLVVHETRFTLYTLDPEGNRVGLSSYPDPSGRNP